MSVLVRQELSHPRTLCRQRQSIEPVFGFPMIRREDETFMTGANNDTIRRTLESGGVEFIDEKGGGPGVRLRKSRKERPRK
jgi:hypothetical protein